MPNFSEPVNMLNSSNEIVITIHDSNGDIVMGGNGADGDINIRNRNGDTRIRIDGDTGEIRLFDNSGSPAVTLSRHGRISLGNTDNRGLIELRDNDNQRKLILTGSGNITAGGNDGDGTIIIQNSDATNSISLKTSPSVTEAAFRTSDRNVISISTFQGGGGLAVGNSRFPEAIRLIGGESSSIFPAIEVGQSLTSPSGPGAHGTIRVFDNDGHATIELDGNSGVVTSNGDIAEEFECIGVKISEAIGTVMVFDENGVLTESSTSNDKRVAGIVSGAGNYSPGIILDRKTNGKNRLPIGVVGKVMCKVDSKYGKIELGDMLTTSDTPGHAMRVSDFTKSNGAIIGKALQSHDKGKGLILALVSLG